MASSQACTDCEGGKFSDSEAKTSATDCGTCVAGKYSGAGAAVCTDCAAGKFAAGTASTVCTDCDTGKFSGLTAQTSSAACTDCDAGKYWVGKYESAWYWTQGLFCTTPPLINVFSS
jgi:hypothetical protein